MDVNEDCASFWEAQAATRAQTANVFYVGRRKLQAANFCCLQISAVTSAHQALQFQFDVGVVNKEAKARPSSYLELSCAARCRGCTSRALTAARARTATARRTRPGPAAAPDTWPRLAAARTWWNPCNMQMIKCNVHHGDSVTQTQRLKIRYFWNFIFCHLNIVRV